MPKRGSLKSAGKRQESATFLQRNFFNVALQFGQNDSRTVAVQLLQRSIPKIAVQLPSPLVACCGGGGLSSCRKRGEAKGDRPKSDQKHQKSDKPKGDRNRKK